MDFVPNLPTPKGQPLRPWSPTIWTAGDMGRIALLLQVVGESLCDAVDLHDSDRVIDVVARDGDASLAAALGTADVLSSVRMSEGPGRHREFEDGAFDVALSTFGVMFAPHPDRAAAELVRLVKPGGRIGLATWTPRGFFGELLRVLKRSVPRGSGLATVTEWGVEARLVERFERHASEIQTARQTYVFHYPSASHWIDVFRKYYGPIHRTFAALDAKGQEALRRALTRLLERFNCADHDGLIVPAEYLRVVIRRA